MDRGALVFRIMPRRFNFSLGSLLLATSSVSALLSGIIELNRNADLYIKQQEMTSAQLYDIAWQIRAHMDETHGEFYPATLDDLAAKNALDFPQRFFTNP